jgi:hypothetical protein
LFGEKKGRECVVNLFVNYLINNRKREIRSEKKIQSIYILI